MGMDKEHYKRYTGINYYDVPKGGGSYVEENQDAHEAYNFDVVKMLWDGDTTPKNYCLGFVETKHNKEGSNELHIEKIRGCELLKNDSEAKDVLVVCK